MLSDSQIERYSRQIVLPEIGGRGQQRLLASAVSIDGGGEAALVCARYLAGAGVGRLALGDASARSALLAEARNPDCRVVTELDGSADVWIVVGDCPRELPVDAVILWGCVDGATVSRVHVPPGQACAPCLGDFARGRGQHGVGAHILGTLLALEALRALVGLADTTAPSVLSIDLDRARTTTLPFPRCR